jgi:hypothetical protein
MNWPLENSPNNPLATPVFDTWGWSPYWSKQDWLTWHNTLKSEFGQPIANDKWVNAWLSRSGFFEAFGDVRGDWVTFDSAFRQYLSSHNTSAGINMLAAIVGGNPITSVMGGATDVVSSAGETLTNLTDAAQSTTKTVKYILPALLILAVVAAAVILWPKLKAIKL